MATTVDIYNANRHLFRSVPNEHDPHVCHLCLGAVSGYAQCYNCRKLFLESNCPESLRRHVVPMTTAINPSPWYGMLWTYKAGQFREYAAVLAALSYQWLTRHQQHIAEMLGGGYDYVTVVPSKKDDQTFVTQPLRRALAIVRPLGEQLREVLEHVPESGHHRSTYTPQIFRTVGNVVGDRIVLIEDTWITGATAVSAAGALLEAGAQSIFIAPVARDVRLAYHGKDHPYFEHLKTEYDIDSWPRSD